MNKMKSMINYLNKLKETADKLDLNEVDQISEVLARAYHADKSVFIIGN